MPVPKEELVKDLETPEYQAIVKETLAKKEFVIQDKAEHAAFLDRYKTDVVEKEIPTRLKAVYDSIDKEVKETFGADRAQDEKTYDYVKRVGKSTVEQVTTLKTKVSQLEEAAKTSDPTGAYRRQLDEAEQRYKAVLKEKEDAIEGLKKEHGTVSKTADIKMIFGSVKTGFKKDLPALHDRIESVVLGEAITRAKQKDGKYFMTNADGTFMKDPLYNEITVEDWLKKEFKDSMSTAPKGGAGSGGSGGGKEGPDPSTITVENFVLPESINTRLKLGDYLDEIGLKKGNPMRDKIWAKVATPAMPL